MTKKISKKKAGNNINEETVPVLGDLNVLKTSILEDDSNIEDHPSQERNVLLGQEEMLGGVRNFETKISKIYITEEGFKKLKKELHLLQRDEMPLAITAKSHAQQYGDLSENAEYKAAKEKIRYLEHRIQEIRQIISDCEIVDISNISCDEVSFGNTVTLREESTKKEMEITIVGQTESDPEKNLFSIAAPLVSVLLGHKEGQRIPYRFGKYNEVYTILKIEAKKNN